MSKNLNKIGEITKILKKRIIDGKTSYLVEINDE